MEGFQEPEPGRSSSSLWECGSAQNSWKCQIPTPRGAQGSLNHGMVWLGRGSKPIQPKWGHLQAEQGSEPQAGLGCSQGWGGAGAGLSCTSAVKQHLEHLEGAGKPQPSPEHQHPHPSNDSPSNLQVSSASPTLETSR